MDTVSPEQRSRNMSKIKGKDTSLELKVRSLIHKLGFRYRLHAKTLPGVPDIVLGRRRKVIFVHGCFWHGHTCGKAAQPKTNREFWELKLAKNQERDARVQRELADLGWQTLVIWGCQTKDVDSLEKTLVEFLQAGTIRDETS